MATKSSFKVSLQLAGYLIYLLLLVKVSTVKVNQLYIILGLLPLAVMPVKLYIFNKQFRKNVNQVMPILAFFGIYALISSYNLGVLQRGSTYFIAFVIHAVIFMHMFKNGELKNTDSITRAFLFVSVIAVFIPHFIQTGSVTFGAFYNLTGDYLPTITTIEGPLIVAILFLSSAYSMLYNKKYTALNIGSLVFSVLTLLIFNRRGFIFSSALAIGVYFLYTKFKNKIFLYAAMLMLFLPVFWEAVSYLIVESSHNKVFSSVIVRNKASELVSATGRVNGWKRIWKEILDFNPSHIFGYFGGPPPDLFLSQTEHGRYMHAHNTIFELFVEGGYVTAILFLVAILLCYRKYFESNTGKIIENNFFVVLLIFLLFLSGTETLIERVQYSSFIFVTTMIGVFMLTQFKNITFQVVQERRGYESGLTN